MRCWLCCRDGLDTQLLARGRHDPCVVPRAVPMVEAMVALVLADHLLQVCNLHIVPVCQEQSVPLWRANSALVCQQPSQMTWHGAQSHLFHGTHAHPHPQQLWLEVIRRQRHS